MHLISVPYIYTTVCKQKPDIQYTVASAPSATGSVFMPRSGIYFGTVYFLRQGYFDKYDPSINPSAAQGFTTAAYRFGHSLLPSTVGKQGKIKTNGVSVIYNPIFRGVYTLFKIMVNSVL